MAVCLDLTQAAASRKTIQHWGESICPLAETDYTMCGASTAIRGKYARDLESMMNRLIQTIMAASALSMAGVAVAQATHTTATTKTSTTTHTMMKAKPASAASEEKMESKATEKAETMHATKRHHRRHHHHAMMSKTTTTKKVTTTSKPM